MGSERTARAGTERGDASRTFALVSRLLERSLDDMTLAQFRILLLVARAPERASRLATQAAISRPSLTGVLDGLVSRGWVRRLDVDGDRRGVSLEVTAAGRRALRDAQRAVGTQLDEILSLLESDRRAVAEQGLVALGEALDLDLERRRAAKSETGA